ncbi:MAG: hypothetical protein ACLQU5_33610 [Isosphaeraceae bacterium]
MGRWLFLPDSVQDDLEVLSRASVERIGKLRSLLDSEEGLRTFSLYLRVAEILDISDQEAASLFSFWEYVQQERTEREKTGAETVAEFLAFLERKIKAGYAEEDTPDLKAARQMILGKKEALAALFEECPKREFARKTSMLERGPLPYLAGIRSFCDARPIFSKDGSEIVDTIAVITLRLATHNSHLDETKEVLINLRELDLDRIEEEIRRIRSKMDSLKRKYSLESERKSKRNRGK